MTVSHHFQNGIDPDPEILAEKAKIEKKVVAIRNSLMTRSAASKKGWRSRKKRATARAR